MPIEQLTIANVDQDNDATQGNTNDPNRMTISIIAANFHGDPEAGETQEAELENEAEQENKAKINQAAFAGQM